MKKYRDQSFTVHTHTHPPTGQTIAFSATDDEHANSQFERALLYAGSGEHAVDGSGKIEGGNGKDIHIDPAMKMKSEENFVDVDMSKSEEGKRETTNKT